MHFFKAVNWLCLLGGSVLAQSPEGSNTSDVSALSVVATTTTVASSTFLGDKSDFFNTWAQVEASPTITSKIPKYKRPTSSREPPITSNKKYTRSIESSSKSTKLPKYMKTQATTGPRDVSDLPVCVPVCVENASVFTSCDGERKDCVCMDNKYQKILYYCLKSICEPEELSYAVQFVTKECSPYLSINKEGEPILFHDNEVHQQEELRQLYARNNLGSGVASGVRPNGPTALPFPKEYNEGYNVEVIVTTIVTEYVSEALYPRATAALEKKWADEGNNAHGLRRLRRTKRHHV